MSPRIRSLVATAAAACAAAVTMVPAATAAAPTLPTLNVAVSGSTGISVSGSMVSGAVNVVSTFSGKAPSGPNAGASYSLMRLNPGVTFTQAAAAVNSHQGDPNALTPLAALVVSASPGGTLQTMLTPGNWVALNTSANGTPPHADFTVTAATAPAALPAARATETAIDFGFRGPTVLHAGSVVRGVNAGYLVHMIVLLGVKSRAAGNAVVKLAHQGKATQRGAQKYTNNQFGDIMEPVSPGGEQQSVLNVKPGWYVEACFMNTQDGREHINLGMARLVHVVK